MFNSIQPVSTKKASFGYSVKAKQNEPAIFDIPGGFGDIKAKEISNKDIISNVKKLLSKPREMDMSTFSDLTKDVKAEGFNPDKTLIFTRSNTKNTEPFKNGEMYIAENNLPKTFQTNLLINPFGLRPDSKISYEDTQDCLGTEQTGNLFKDL